MFYCLTDATSILYDENTVTDVFLCLGNKWHNQNMPDVLWCVLAKCLFLRHFCQDHKNIHFYLLYKTKWQHFQNIREAVAKAEHAPAFLKPQGCHTTVWPLGGSMVLNSNWDWLEPVQPHIPSPQGRRLAGTVTRKEPLYKHSHLCHLETLHSISRCSKVLVEKWHPELCCEKCAS